MLQVQHNPAPNAVAKIEIYLLPNGNVLANAATPSRQVMLMMLETAKFDLERVMREKELNPIQAAPPGLDVRRVG